MGNLEFVEQNATRSQIALRVFIVTLQVAVAVGFYFQPEISQKMQTRKATTPTQSYSVVINK
ncbi:MAG: hypothetical protein R2827_13135 [Bdellovibrionales bacterium]